MSVVRKAPEIREREQNMPEESLQDTGVRREEMTVDTLKSVREIFLNPVEYALPDEMRTVRKEVFRTLGEAQCHVDGVIGNMYLFHQPQSHHILVLFGRMLHLLQPQQYFFLVHAR